MDQLTACCAAEYKDVTLVELQVRTRGLPTAAQAVAPVASLDGLSEEAAEPVAKTLRVGSRQGNDRSRNSITT